MVRPDVENEELKRLARACPTHGADAPKGIVVNPRLGVRFVVCAARGCATILLRVERPADV